MKDYKLSLPLIEYRNIWFRIVFERPDLQKNSYQQRMSSSRGIKRGVEKGIENLSDKQIIIIDLIKKNPCISKKQIQKIGGLSKKSVEYNIQKLKKMDVLCRVGPAKGGHWEVKKEK
jgi:predicted HTH transcriptional regulator